MAFPTGSYVLAVMRRGSQQHEFDAAGNILFRVEGTGFRKAKKVTPVGAAEQAALEAEVGSLTAIINALDALHTP